jgi:hypothetical protein
MEESHRRGAQEGLQVLHAGEKLRCLCLYVLPLSLVIFGRQLWGLGRVADPTVAPKHGNYDFISSGDVPEAEGKPKPRPLTKEEIKEVVQLYAQAAKNAIAAGCDGVEVCMFPLSVFEFEVFSPDFSLSLSLDPRCQREQTLSLTRLGTSFFFNLWLEKLFRGTWSTSSLVRSLLF